MDGAVQSDRGRRFDAVSDFSSPLQVFSIRMDGIKLSIISSYIDGAIESDGRRGINAFPGGVSPFLLAVRCHGIESSVV